MKRIFAATGLAGLFVLTGASIVGKRSAKQASATLHADEGATCSLATVAGKYGFTLTGTLLLPTGPVPGGAVGIVTLDAQGHVSGTEARNVGGSFANETFTGTETLSPNCTATSTLKFFESGQLVRTSVITLVWDDNLNAFRFVQQSLTVPDGTNVPVVVTGEGRKITPNSDH
jgi:hypothetical protein